MIRGKEGITSFLSGIKTTDDEKLSKRRKKDRKRLISSIE